MDDGLDKNKGLNNTNDFFKTANYSIRVLFVTTLVLNILYFGSWFISTKIRKEIHLVLSHTIIFDFNTT